MYQVIDQQEDEELAPRARFSILPFIIGALLAAIVFFIVWLMSPGQQSSPGRTVETPASRAAYLKALGEQDPAVRRARLMDYQRVHPDTDRSDAIADQLDVINTAELPEWEDLVKVIYNERLPVEDKHTALSIYENRWNGRLLGGRSEDLTDLRLILDNTVSIDLHPSRSLEPGDSPISEEIPSDILAGAPPRMAITFPIPESSLEPAPLPLAVFLPKDKIVQPSVRRSSSPNYPRSAKRRNIGAIVVIEMDIDEKGKVESVDTIEVQAERYEKDFQKSAERAAKRTRFNPKTINGEAVPALGVRKRYIFKAN